MQIRSNMKAGGAPGGKTHLVKPGETLRSISADYYGTKAGWLPICMINKLQDCDKIYAGQQLIIPNL